MQNAWTVRAYYYLVISYCDEERNYSPTRAGGQKPAPRGGVSTTNCECEAGVPLVGGEGLSQSTAPTAHPWGSSLKLESEWEHVFTPGDRGKRHSE